VTSTEELFSAIEAGDVEAVREIVAGDASLAAARDAEGVSALMRARYGFDRELVQAVMAGEPALDVFEAAAFGDQGRLMELLERDPSLSTAFSADGFSALHLAAFFGQVDAARLLLDRGSEVDARGSRWMTGTALHSASSGSHVAVARLLLEAGADPNARQSGGWTPLHSAAHNGDSELVSLLLGHGADPTAVNHEGATVLALAEEEGDADSVARIRRALG
jgi:ankyrin repeat protein